VSHFYEIFFFTRKKTYVAIVSETQNETLEKFKLTFETSFSRFLHVRPFFILFFFSPIFVDGARPHLFIGKS